MTQMPPQLYTAEQVRELDRLTIEEQGIPGYVLMKRAGRAALRVLLDRWPKPEPITVYCGGGNNGGDGYVVAGLAAQKKLDVRIVQVAPAEKLKGDAHRAWEFARQEGVPMDEPEDGAPPRSGVIVDALLGTGISGEVRERFARAIETINASGLPVLAIDIPSGLSSDTGMPLGPCIEAAATVTFIGLKRGLMTGRGPALCGELVFDDLDAPETVYDQVPARTLLSQWSLLKAGLPRRPADAHKGLFGHVMIVGGELGFGGAVAMAAEAALRVGPGLVSVATRPEHVPAILARCPEVMAAGVISGQELEPLLERPSVLVVGPGLGRTPWSEQLLQKALASGLPMVLDADALNILSEGRVGRDADTANAVLTPHPGEAARLLGCDTGEVQADRFRAVSRLRERYGGVALLKGAGTLVGKRFTAALTAGKRWHGRHIERRDRWAAGPGPVPLRRDRDRCLPPRPGGGRRRQGIGSRWLAGHGPDSPVVCPHQSSPRLIRTCP